VNKASISVSGQVYNHSLTLPFVIEVSVPSQENEQPCISVLGVSILPVSVLDISLRVLYTLP
jgi:hypothetical protein